VAFLGGNINETLFLPETCFYISRLNLRLGIRTIPFSKWAMFSKILSLLRCQNDLYFQNDNQKTNISSQRSPCIYEYMYKLYDVSTSIILFLVRLFSSFSQNRNLEEHYVFFHKYGRSKTQHNFQRLQQKWNVEKSYVFIHNMEGWSINIKLCKWKNIYTSMK